MRTSAKAPKPIKVARPKVEPSELLDCFGWAALGVDQAMSLALSWYEINTPKLLFGNPLDPEQLKNHSKAEKCYRLGSITTNEGERENSYRMALRCYEKVFSDKHGLPKFNEGAQPVIPKRVAAMAATINTLNGAFSSLGMRFLPTMKEEREVHNGAVLVPMKELAGMSSRSLLATAFAEFSSAIKAASLVPDPTPENASAMRLDGAKLFSEAIPNALDGILKWAETLPTRDLFKMRLVPHTAKVPGAPKVPRAPGVPRAAGAPKDRNHPYRDGTVKAQIFALLSDLKPHTIHDIDAAIVAAGAKPGLWRTVGHDGAGVWTIHQTGKSIRLEFL